MNDISSVTARRLCAQCGMCAAVCPASCIVWTEQDRPSVAPGCTGCGLCAASCPGAPVQGRRRSFTQAASLDDTELWVGASADPSIRHDAASGGFVTAFLLDLLSRGQIDGALVMRADPQNPLSNRPFIARTREDVLSSMGSRYAPSPSCLALRDLPPSGRYALVGKPCDVDAVRRLQARDKRYAACIDLTIGLVCAGMPKPSALSRLLDKSATAPGDVRRIRYRGDGWPGVLSVTRADGSEWTMPYHDAWGGYLSRERSVRCALCDDPFSLCADIVAGDPWGEEYKGEPDGLSMVLLRTPRGKERFHARADGVFDAKQLPTDELFRLQSSLKKKFENHPAERIAYQLAVARRIRPEAVPGGLKGLYRAARRIAYYLLKKPV